MSIYHTLCVLLPCTLVETALIMIRKGDSDSPLRHRNRRILLHLVWILLLCLYLDLLLSVTGIGTIWDIGKYDSIIRTDEINLIPFSDVRKDGYFDYPNILLFTPLGFFLPSIWKSMRTSGKTIILGFVLSFCVELCQLFNYRVSDVTDLIYNTIGTFLGFLAWVFCRMLFSHRLRKTVQISAYCYCERWQRSLHRIRSFYSALRHRKRRNSHPRS